MIDMPVLCNVHLLTMTHNGLALPIGLSRNVKQALEINVYSLFCLGIELLDVKWGTNFTVINSNSFACAHI